MVIIYSLLLYSNIFNQALKIIIVLLMNTSLIRIDFKIIITTSKLKYQNKGQYIIKPKTIFYIQYYTIL